MWQKVTYEPGLPSDITMLIIQAFPVAFLAAGKPEDMAVFARHIPGEHTYTVYFSPTASELAKLCPTAVRCEKPDSDGLGLLAGEQTCWPLLFSQP
jgi:hypothetical protein